MSDETKEKYNAYMLAWYHKNKEKVQGWKKKYYLENRERFIEKQRQYRKNNREKIRISNSVYRQDHIEWARRIVQKSAWKLKLEVFSHYCQGVPRCVHCGEQDVKVLQVDHIGGGGNVHRRELGLSGAGKTFYRWLKKQGFPEGYQVLCSNCNIRKLYSERNLYCGEE